MKKTIIAIFAVLLIFAAVACNDNVDNKLNGETHTTHTLAFDEKKGIYCTGCNSYTTPDTFLAVVDGSTVVDLVDFSEAEKYGLKVSGTDLELKDENTTSSFVVKTNGGKLTVNTPKAALFHYGSADNVTIKAVAPHSYYGTAEIKSITVNQGHIVLTVEVPKVEVEATSDVSFSTSQPIAELSVKAADGSTKVASISIDSSSNIEKVDSKAPMELSGSGNVEEITTSETITIDIPVSTLTVENTTSSEEIVVKTSKAISTVVAESAIAITGTENGTGTVDSVAASKPVSIAVEVESIDVKSNEVSIAYNDGAKVSSIEVKIDDATKADDFKLVISGEITEATKPEVIGAKSVETPNSTIHIHNWKAEGDATPATCTAPGSQKYKCDGCGMTDIKEIPVIAHTPVTDAAVAATCTKTGLTEGSHCSVCKTVLVSQKITAALGHSWDSGVVTTEATETTEGVRTFTCTRCKETKTEVIPTKNHTHTISKDWTNDETNHWHEASCGLAAHRSDVSVHTFEKDSKNSVSPTCTEKGKDHMVCNVCGYAYDVEVAALGHDFIDHVAKAASCTATGWNAYQTCSRCDYSNKVEIAKTAHTPVPEKGVAATCIKSGLEDGTKCSVCQAIIEQKVIPALGHDYVDHAAKAATCTEAGWDAYQTCSRCDYSSYKEIPAKGHTVVVDKAVAATCTEAGRTEGSHCSVCGTVIKAQETVPALGHDLVHHEAKQPTDTEVGWYAYDTCKRCDYTTYVEIPAKKISVHGTLEKKANTSDPVYELYCSLKASFGATQTTEISCFNKGVYDDLKGGETFNASMSTTSSDSTANSGFVIVVDDSTQHHVDFSVDGYTFTSPIPYSVVTYIEKGLTSTPVVKGPTTGPSTNIKDVYSFQNIEYDSATGKLSFNAKPKMNMISVTPVNNTITATLNMSFGDVKHQTSEVVVSGSASTGIGNVAMMVAEVYTNKNNESSGSGFVIIPSKEATKFYHSDYSLMDKNNKSAITGAPAYTLTTYIDKDLNKNDITIKGPNYYSTSKPVYKFEITSYNSSTGEITFKATPNT